ncbi:uncharacterized protein N7529_007446 [Penicillium soppii]|jgi:hypothetical protein|uniref:uncharacterized protein n=1 Tax=Penicillium soppii TaxID=69789 RepID=UPI002547F70E|nr:uncharacterized protein N7529_007446 [Penicillium soppii]KAJ5860136.1 hypothetical protein N7529_007446 [Penicillium soppii]
MSSQSSSRVPQAKFARENLVIRPQKEFLWVDYKENQSKARDLVRSKQAFVRTRHHRLRREKQVQSTARVVDVSRHPKSESDEDDLPTERAPILASSPQAGILDGSPSLAISTNHNPNIYFHHCEYISHQTLDFPIVAQSLRHFLLVGP